MIERSSKIVVDETGIIDHVNRQSSMIAEALLLLDSANAAVGTLRPFLSTSLDAEDLRPAAIELRLRASQLFSAAQLLLDVAGSFDGAAHVARKSAPFQSPAPRAAKESRARRA